MKQFKKLVMCAAVAFAFCFLFANVISVQAAEQEKTAGNIYVAPTTDAAGNWISQTKFRMNVGDFQEIRVEHASQDSIQNISTKKGLEAAVTYSSSSEYSGDGTTPYTYGRSIIEFYATKAGTYNVAFDVVDKAGVNRGTQRVTIQVVNDSGVIKKATFNGKVVSSASTTFKNEKEVYQSTYATKVSGKSGKLKLTANKQYKITGVMAVTVNEKGVYAYKKVGKTGGKVTLSKAYSSTSKNADGDSYKPAKKCTYILVSYKDKFFGSTTTYSVCTKRGRKEIKCVTKNGITGTISTSYSKCPSSQLTLWQY